MPTTPIANPPEQLYAQIRQVLQAAQTQAQKAINHAMVQCYWEIGRIIVEYEQGGEARAEYGKQTLQYLSNRLSKEFGKGFDERNLRYIRAFYLLFPIRNAVSSKLMWTHYRHLLRVENHAAREWYANEAITQGWSTRALDRQISTLYYERLLSSGDAHKAGVAAEAKQLIAERAPPDPRDFIRDPYVLEFLQAKAGSELYEKELEQGLIDQLQQFLMELGKGFAFVARQKHLRVEGEDFFVDMIFYNYLLKCFVLIDLKIGKLTHQDVGQMDMYVRVFEEQCRNEGDNPTLGLLLCSERNHAVARYSQLAENPHLFASKYSLCLPTEEELRQELERDRSLVETTLAERQAVYAFTPKHAVSRH